MRERYVVSPSFDGQLLRFLLRKAKLDLPLAEIIDICLVFFFYMFLSSIWTISMIFSDFIVCIINHVKVGRLD